MTTPSKAPRHFRFVAIFALLFNGFGAYDWLMSLGGADYYRQANFTEAQIAYQTGFPAWVQMVWATGVWLALLGTILLVSRRRQAAVAFAVATVCAAASAVYQNLMVPGWPVMGAMTAMSWVILAVCAGLTAYSVWMTRQGVLR